LHFATFLTGLAIDFKIDKEKVIAKRTGFPMILLFFYNCYVQPNFSYYPCLTLSYLTLL